MKRRALGKGLGSLLPEKRLESTVDSLVQVDVDRVMPNPNQPRQSFDDGELQDLAASIKAAGILQPILLREAEPGYELIAGERRLRAARLAGLRTVPALVQRVERDRSLELALIENIQREELNPIDEARAFAKLVSEHGLTQEQVAEKVGRKRSSIANSMRLLKLPASVQAWMKEGKLTSGHAKALLALADDEEILKAAEAMLQGFVTVRGAEEMIRERKPPRSAAPSGIEEADPNVRDAELRMQRTLGTKVRIRRTPAGRGRIEIDFYSDEDLMRLFEVIAGRTA